jgi:phosphoesterase RecJ-like protein
VEQPNSSVKVSWRSQQGVDISQIALQFGGGGHPAAAGAELEGSLESVRNKVLEETYKLLEIHTPLHI